MQLLMHILVTFLTDKMILFLPEELIMYLKDESTTYIKPMCTHAIEITLMFLKRMIADAMGRCSAKTMTYSFNEEELCEPTYANMV